MHARPDRRRIVHPILKRDVLRADGTRAVGLHVFCRVRQTAMALDFCLGCPSATEVDTGARPALSCDVSPEAIRGEAPDPSGRRTATGAAVLADAVCVEADVSVSRVAELLLEGDHRGLPVLDDGGRLLGVVHEAVLVLFRRDLPGPAFHKIMRRASAVDIMQRSVAIDERTPVRAALRAMAAAHLREAPVIDANGVPIGMFRDIDGLRCLGKARTRENEDEALAQTLRSGRNGGGQVA